MAPVSRFSNLSILRNPALRSGLLSLALFAIVGFIIRWGVTSESAQLTVVTFGGKMREAQIEVIGARLAERGLGNIVWAESLGELAPVAAQVRGGTPVWDVVSLPTSYVVTGCERGWLEPISSEDLADVQFAAFEPGTRSECGVGSHIWAMVMTHRCDGQAIPSRIDDFFDLKRFPGRRGLPRFPKGVLEWALLADGVPPDDVYRRLRTEAGLRQAFAKLDTIKGKVVWWESGAQAAQLLVDGEVVMGMAPSARVALAAQVSGLPLCVQWSNAIHDVDAWAILKGSKNRTAALEFIRNAIAPEVQSELSLRYPNAPVLREGVRLVREASPRQPDFRSWLATTPENRIDTLTLDAEFWADRGEVLQLRFMEWQGRR